MSMILKDDLIRSCADAYREVSGTTGLIAAGTLAEKISGLSSPEGIILTKTDGKVTAIDIKGVSNLVKNQFNDSFYRNAEIITSDVAFAKIPEYAFAALIKLTAIDDLISGVSVIDNYAFRMCSSLESVTFSTTPTEIGSSAFASCGKLTMIRVPWEENEVLGAPWGAGNATIVYGYEGDAT